MNRENITGIYSEWCLPVRHPVVILLIILLEAHKVNGLEKNMQTFTSTHHTHHSTKSHGSKACVKMALLRKGSCKCFDLVKHLPDMYIFLQPLLLWGNTLSNMDLTTLTRIIQSSGTLEGKSARLFTKDARLERKTGSNKEERWGYIVDSKRNPGIRLWWG